MTSTTFPDEDEFTPGTAAKELRYDYANEKQSTDNEETINSFFDEPIDEMVTQGSAETALLLNKGAKP